MVELTADEMKETFVGILCNVANFCKANDIKYSLAYGTLIGAIRHKGFIPWDDDIDIIMMRDEYERFVSLYKDDRYRIISGDEQANHLHIRVSDSNTVLEYTKNTAQSKIYKGGLWIDVFPIDRVPDTQKEYQSLFKKIKRLSYYRFIGDFGGDSLKLRIAHLFFYIVRAVLEKKINNLMISHNKKDCHTAANLSLYYLNWPQFPLNYMDEFVDVEFEGHTFKAIKQYDVWLRGIYGDYMQFPPEDKRVAHHYYKSFIKKE